MAEVGECLHSKCEVLGKTLVPPPKKKKSTCNKTIDIAYTIFL
jgi:hypothetical protein